MNAQPRPPRPETTPFDGLPDCPAIRELQARDRWVSWDHHWKAEDQKWVKMPINPTTGGEAKVNEPATWSTYQEADDRCRTDGLAGVGYVLIRNDGITGIDLDKCRNKDTGALESWATEIIALNETYAEVSPSGTGVRLFGRGNIEKSRMFHPAGVELYHGGRYLTLTGQRIAGAPDEIRAAPKTIAALLERIDRLKGEATKQKKAEQERHGPKVEQDPWPFKSTGAFGFDWSAPDPFYKNVNALCYHRLDEWVPKLFLNGIARKQPDGKGYRVSSHDLGRDLEEDLCISRMGILDFGVWDMGDERGGRRSPIDLVLEWGGVKDATAADAALWLCAQLGQDPAGIGWRGGSAGDKAKGEESRQSIVIESAAELRHQVFAPIRYIVEGYIGEGCTLLAGRPKLGKSWLMLDVGLAVAAGRYVLGDTLCQEGDVLYLALEDNRRRLQRRIEKLLGRSFGGEWPKRFQYATAWPRANEGGLEAIRNWIGAVEKPRLVVVDVLAMIRPVRGNKESLYEADYNALKGLQEIAGEFGIAIVVVHHTRKSGSESGDAVEKISGTLGLSGAADAFLVLDRDGQGCTLAGRGRDVEEVDVAVSFDRESCRWTVQGQAAEVRRTDERSMILDALKEADDLMAPGDLADATRMPCANVRQLLVSMVKAGEVTKVSRGRYAHPDRTDLHAADHKRKGDHNDHKITNLDAYRRARDGEDDDDE